MYSRCVRSVVASVISFPSPPPVLGTRFARNNATTTRNVENANHVGLQESENDQSALVCGATVSGLDLTAEVGPYLGWTVPGPLVRG